MPTTFSERMPATLLRLLYFIPAIAVFIGAAFAPQPWSLAGLMIADALTMVAICRALRFSRDIHLFDAFLVKGSAYLILLLFYTALVAILIGYPLARLLREGSLGTALTLSSTGVIALISVWRWWPAFGLIFVRRLGHSVGIIATTKRSIASAWSLTNANDLFFSHGLIVAICLAALAQGALSLAGIEGALPANFRIAGWLVYVLLVAPAAHWLIARRSASALLAELRRIRGERGMSEESEMVIAAEPPIAVLPDGKFSGTDLNAMLLRCIRAGQVDLALAALARGADPNCLPDPDDRDQRAPLVLAAVSPDLRLLRGLIEKGGDVNRRHAGIAPLLAATRDSHEGRPDAVMTLLTNGADPRHTDTQGNTPLHCAALAARPIVAALLCDADAPLQAVNREGLTPLGVACAAANWELAAFLLDRGAKIEVDHAQPALIAAASIAEDDAHGVKLLLKRRAQVDARGPLERTALMTAALHGHASIAKTLLDSGAHIDLADAHGTTALMEAARSGAHAMFEVFAHHQPAVDLADAHGRTALIIASQSKQACEETVRQLLALRCARDIAAKDGRRAVDYAAAAGRWNIVAMLDPDYPLPANLATPDRQPESPAHLLDALRFAHWHIADSYGGAVRGWSPQERAQLFADLAEPGDSAPRRWLLNHGVDADATLPDSQPLFAALLNRLPNSLEALADLHAAGAQPGGGRVLVRLCATPAASNAIRDDVETLASQMIDRGADVFASDGEGRTPLAHAVAGGYLRVAQVLLERGVDPNTRDRHGCTPLFDALQLPAAAALAAIKMLLRAGAHPEITAANGETPLGLALARGQTDAQRWLNWPGWKLPLRKLRAQDLIAAAIVGDVHAVEKLLALGLPVDAVDAQGASALLRAAGCGHAPLVQFLLKHGANSAHVATTGANALSAAVSARHETVVEALLASGVGVDQRLPGGGTPLMIAAALGYPEIIAQLLAHAAAVDAEDERGVRPLHAAAQFAFQSRDGERAVRTLKLLLDHGASVDASNAAGQTPLLLLLGSRAEPGAVADQRQLLTLLPVLLDRRPDLNAQDKRGVCALHACAMHGLLLPARALLTAGADPGRRDILDRTPRQIAHLLGFIDVAAEIGNASGVTGAAPTSRQPARGIDAV